MRRIAETTLQNRLGIASAGWPLVRIGQTLPDPNLAETMQQRFRLIPPDLDQFNQRLATVLIEHRERIGLRHSASIILKTANPISCPSCAKTEPLAYLRLIKQTSSFRVQRWYVQVFISDPLI